MKFLFEGPIMKVSMFIALVLLSGCATCRNHPVTCNVATTLVISGALAAYEDHRIRRDISQAEAQAQPPR